MQLEIESVANITLAGLIARRKEIRAKLYPPTRPSNPRHALWTPEPLPDAPPPHCAQGLPEPPETRAASLPADISRPPTIRQIVVAVAQFYDLPLADMLSASRKHKIVRVRQIASYLANTITDKHLPEIGRRIGGKDHTTVLYSIRRIASLLKSDPPLAAQIDGLQRRLSRDEGETRLANPTDPTPATSQQAKEKCKLINR